MSNLKEYNDEPVHYCKNCLSLNIKTVVAGLDLDYCDDCGGTDIAQSNIDNWEDFYRKKYGFDYLTNKIYDGRER